MAYLGKTFKRDSSENYEEFVAALNVPEEYAQKLLNYKPDLKLEKDGDSYTFHTIVGDKDKTITFTPDVEFEEEIDTQLVAKSTVTVDGDVFIHSQVYPTGKTFTLKREFSEESVKVTMTLTGWDGEAVLYYVAA